MNSRGALPYVLPFAVFLAFLAVNSFAPIPQWARFLIEIALIVSVSRHALRGAPVAPFAGLLVGLAVFLVWIAPDLLIPGYRSLPLFQNAITGRIQTAAPRFTPTFLAFRILNSVVAIPILEELFWRGFLLRWLVDRDFKRVNPHRFSAQAFWLVAILFASEHGPYWDVGLAAGAIYNWWMLRTGRLADCILAHAVTNACLAAYVIGFHQWQYWL